jgi:2-oxoglutarate dehydrogenase E1 component
VNADDPEAVIWTAQLAAEYRQRFQKDIVIDLVGYRRHGHNETDEPGFTQPTMYKMIAKHPTVLTQYGERLVAEGTLSADELKKKQADFRARLQEAYDLMKSGDTKSDKFKDKYPKVFDEIFHPVHGDEQAMEKPANTAVSVKTLSEIGKKIAAMPSGFNVHPKLQKLLEQRSKMVDKDGPGVDWPMAELLAFGSLAKDGHHIRLSGQDCQRGTFSSRQAVLRDFETGVPYYSMNNIAPGQATVEILNSPLSELGVMGFEFGYTVADKDALVLWEGQFGDFVNGAQIVIDQFLVASEAKWGQTSSLVLLLPHGYEGMGPEHSSGRPERFLQLCGNANIQVAIPTTAAQYFHILRRQLCRDFRKPLVIMSPKSLLRHAKVVSPITDFEKGQFEEVIDDVRIKDAKSVTRLVFCTGKIFYEMLEATSTAPEGEVALVRIEQLYPFPAKKVEAIINRYKNLSEVLWVQEEPQNMGAWTFVRPRLEAILQDPKKLRYVGRRDSGTTAEGSTKAHTTEQARIINEAVNPGVVSVSAAKVSAKR